MVVVFFIIATYTDITSQKIKNRTTASLASISAILYIVAPLIQGNWQEAGVHALGGLLGFLILLVPAATLMVKIGGDIKFAGAAGIALGGLVAVTWVLTSAVMVGIIGGYNVKKNGGTYWDTIPFAPFFFISLILHMIAAIVVL